MATYYKAKVDRYDCKMKEGIQSTKSKAGAVEKKTGDLNLENLKLIKQTSLTQAKAIILEEELSKVKEDLETEMVFYETQLESLRTSYQTQVKNLEKEVDNQYDEGLRHSYRCIMAVLEKQHPDLKMDELVVGVIEYLKEEVGKESEEEPKPNATNEAISPLRPTSIDAPEASTHPGTTGETPPAPQANHSSKAALLVDSLSS